MTIVDIVHINDFKKDGVVDWNALHAAQIANGENCTQCRGLIIYPKGFPVICYSCQEFTEVGEVTHAVFVRCPVCAKLYDVVAHASDAADYGIFSEGEHNVTCPNCEYEFEVSTAVSYFFTSPEKKL